MKINTILTVSLLSAGFLFSTGCKNAGDFPPSKFIGFYGSYNGCKNGELPATVDNYTGKWTSRNGLLTGSYKNGIPAGEWIKYYQNMQKDSVIFYNEDGTYAAKDWYPDGTLKSQSTGTYNFSGDGVKMKPEQQQFWNWRGEKINTSAATESSVFRYTQQIPQMPHGMLSAVSEKYAAPCFATISGNNFEIALYLIDREDKTSPVQKLVIAGECDAKHNVTIKQSANQKENRLRFSDYVIKDKVLNLNFYAPGKAEESNKITVQLYLK